MLPWLFWPTVRKNCPSETRETFEIRGWRPRICKNFEITRKICLSSESAEQFLVTECFCNLFLEVSQIQWIRFQIGKNYWDLKTCRKSYKRVVTTTTYLVLSTVPEPWLGSTYFLSDILHARFLQNWKWLQRGFEPTLIEIILRIPTN